MSNGTSTIYPDGGPALPSDLVCPVLEYLSPNDIALAGRFTCQEAARGFRSARFRTASLSQPIASHAAQSFQLDAQPRVRMLTFRKKLGLMAIAAASGSEVNMAAASSLLRPQLFPELLSAAASGMRYTTMFGDPGSAACERGHPHLVRWMVQHSCPLSPTRTLAAAARHCDLGALRDLWQLLRSLPGPPLQLDHYVLGAAAASTTPDALAKAEWVLAEGAGSCELTPTIACTLLEAAAGSSTTNTGDTICSSSTTNTSDASSGGGSSSSSRGGASTADAFMSRLQWLQSRGCQLRGDVVLGAALRLPSDVFPAVADKVSGSQGLLWDGGRSAGGGGSMAELLATGRGGGWNRLRHAALSGPGSAAKLRWLKERGVGLDEGTILDAARQGNLEALVYLHEACGLPLNRIHVMGKAVESGSIRTAAWLLQAGCQTSYADICCAADHGRRDMVQWLVQEARCPLQDGFHDSTCELLRTLVLTWGRATLSDRRPVYVRRPDPCHGVGEDAELLATVQLLLGAGCGVDLLTLCAAVDRGDLALVRLLHGTGRCATGRIELDKAARPGCEALVDFLAEKGYVVVDPMATCDAAYAHAARAGDLGMLMALRRLGVPWGRGTLNATVHEGVPPGGAPLCALRWMVEQGMPATGEVAREVLLGLGMPGAAMEKVAAWLRELAADGEEGDGASGGSDEVAG